MTSLVMMGPANKSKPPNVDGADLPARNTRRALARITVEKGRLFGRSRTATEILHAQEIRRPRTSRRLCWRGTRRVPLNDSHPFEFTKLGRRYQSEAHP